MKKICQSILFIVCFFLINATPKQDKTKLLVRKWLLVEFINQNVEDNLKKRGITQERRAKLMKKLVDGSFIDFKADGTYEVSILGSLREKMYWQLDESQNNLLVRKTLAMEAQSIKIEALNKKEFIIILNQAENQTNRLTFVPEKIED